MNRSIVVKLSVVLLVAVLVHSVFWFFKTGQLEKHLNNFIAENAAVVSAAEIKVSGFPFVQKVTIKDLKFSIPNPALNKYQIIAKHLEATSGIFGGDFTLELLDKVMVQDADNNQGNVEFSSAPQISFSVRGGMISHFSYQDVGHHVLDADKNVIYAAAATTVTVDSAVDGNEQITAHLLVNVRDIENFTVLNAYQNASEKRIIDGIKTGEITIGSPNADNLLTPPSAVNGVVVQNIVVPTTQPSSGQALATQVALTLDPQSGTVPVNNNTAENPAVDANASAVVPNAAVNNLEAQIKTSLAVDFEYVLTPSRTEQQAAVPLDLNHMQESVQYNRALKISNLEIANSMYKIIVNGQVNSFQDDNMPSGFVTIRVDNASNFIDYIVNGFNQMAQQKQVASSDVPADVQTADLAAQSSAPQNAYQNFLKKIAAGLPTISRELASKNQLSKDNSAVYDIRREKNLEFVINETPLREVMGKF